jgi:thiol-disulfide isomerase/thioredoxin
VRVPVTAGSLAPEATFRDLAGAPVEVRAVASTSPALVFVWKSDCGACAAAAPVLPRLAAIPGLAVLAAGQEDAATARAFGAAHGWDAAGVHAVVDAAPWAASDALGVAATPTWILLAPGGRVEAVAEGWSRDDANALAARAAALAGAPPRVVSLPGDGPGFRPG